LTQHRENISGGWLLLFFLLLPACGAATGQYTRVDRALSLRNYDEADRIIEKSKDGYGTRSDLLYLMDRGMTLHLSGRYRESNDFLAAAENKIDSLYATSISEQTASLLLNENTISYEGEDFEKVMINIVSALNYVQMGKLEDALVEARKVDHKLTVLNDRYQKKNVYRSDALAQYISGVLYEAEREYNDANISYYKAYEALQNYRKDYNVSIPALIGSDLARTTDALGLIEDRDGYLQKFGNPVWESEKTLSEKGEVVLVAYVGRSPVKIDRIVTVPIPDGSGGIYPVRIAFPQFIPQPHRSRAAEIQIDTPPSPMVRSHLLEPVTAIAVKNLDDRIARISAKAIARATAKAVAAIKIRQEAAKKGSGQKLLADVTTDLFSVASEKADRRSWRTLPGDVILGRVSLPPGAHRLTVRYLSDSGAVVEERTFEVSLKAGEKKFLIDRVLD